MSSLLSVQAISKSFGSRTLFEKISFTISPGDRIGLIGPNGAGKSTLLKILAEEEHTDTGSIAKKQNTIISYAHQAPVFSEESSIREVLLASSTKNDITIETRAEILLSKAQFPETDTKAGLLSGGWKKRLEIIRALMCSPDLLLLDEPTNHLDLEGILWLEQFLRKEQTSYIIVSHDRYFLEQATNKTIELNNCYPDGIYASDVPFKKFLERKSFFLETQLLKEKKLSFRVQEELDWLKRSPKARTTKSRSRIHAAHTLVQDLQALQERNKVSTVDIAFASSERETRKLLVAKNCSKQLGEKTLFTKLSLTLSPGTRLGIVGKNGTGKTTLLKMLAGHISQDTGTIKYAEDLKIVYFDQHREELPGHLSLKEALSPNGEFVEFHGQSIHVNGWAKKFLFSPERLTLPLSALSGGERARILIARLMLQPADVLFLDEPTNDLDIQTLEIIEENLHDFFGAVVLISHDRALMDSVCTEILELGNNTEHLFFADYQQWEAFSKKHPQTKSVKEKTPEKTTPASTIQKKKLSYKEKLELDTMESTIVRLEEEIEAIRKALQKTSSHENTNELYISLGIKEQKLQEHFDRWEFLESFI